MLEWWSPWYVMFGSWILHCFFPLLPFPWKFYWNVPGVLNKYTSLHLAAEINQPITTWRFNIFYVYACRRWKKPDQNCQLISVSESAKLAAPAGMKVNTRDNQEVLFTVIHYHPFGKSGFTLESFQHWSIKAAASWLALICSFSSATVTVLPWMSCFSHR